MKSASFCIHRLAIVALFLPIFNEPASAQDHDLIMAPAFNITAPTSSADWRSPDIKLGADFGDTTVPDIVRRGAVTPIFAKFYINGTLDHTLPTVPAGSLVTNQVQIRFHYLPATVGATPPANPAVWNSIGSLQVEFGATEPFLLTKTWPTDFPSVVTKSIDWTPPLGGSLFWVRAEVEYPAAVTDADPSDNVAVSLYDSILGFRDVDLAIVHDASGSMGYYTYGIHTYLEHAKERAKAFVGSMNVNHRLAVVAFDTCLSGGVDDIWGTPVPPLKFATPANKLAARTAIDGITAGCGTPMGVGIQRAVQILTSEPASPTRKRAILLLSDGEDNSGTPRACRSVPDPTQPCLSEPILSLLQANDIRLYTIALGSAAWSECLECLADGSDGEWYSTPSPGLSLAHVYQDMQQVYSADDLYRVDTGVSGGGDDSYEIYFEGLDDLLYFTLQTDRLDVELNLQIRPPSGSWLAASAVSGASVMRGRGHVVVSVKNPATGSWGYRVVGEERQDYLVAVRSDRVGQRLGLDVRSRGVVGTPIEITARLAEGTTPLQGAQLVANVQVPVAPSLETQLRRLSREFIARRFALPFDPAIQEKNPDLSPRAVFLETLGERQQPLVKTRTVEVALKERQPGVYTGQLERDTGVAGEYRVTVAYRSETADRVQSRSLRLHPGRVDPRRSFAEILQIKERERPAWYLRVYPTDSLGNAVVAANLEKGIEVSLEGAQRIKGLEVVFDSAYQAQLVVDGRHEPTLRAVTIDGREIPIEDGRKRPADIKQDTHGR